MEERTLKGSDFLTGYPSKHIVESLKKRYPAGCRVELVEMNDPYARLKPGEKGTVRAVDDIGTVFVDWDSGSGLGVAYGEDRIRRLNNNE